MSDYNFKKIKNAILCLIFLSIGCGKSGGSGPSASSSAGNLEFSSPVILEKKIKDINMINGLMIIPQKSAGLTSSSAVNTLYSLDANGVVSVVSITGSPCENNGIDSATSTGASIGTNTKLCNHATESPIYPVALFPTQLYVFMAYVGISCSVGNASGSRFFGSLIALEKSSGSLYCIPGMDLFVEDIAKNLMFKGGYSLTEAYYKSIQTDSTGKLIWVNTFGGLRRIDFSNPINPNIATIKILGSANSISDSFAVNAEGDAFLGFGTNGNEGFSSVVELASGEGYLNVGMSQAACIHSSASSTNPNDFYYTAKTAGSAGTYLVQSLSNNSFQAIKNIEVLANVTPAWQCQHGLVKNGVHAYLTHSNDDLTTQNTFLDLVEGDTPKVTFVKVHALKEITQIRGGGDFLYILGSDANGNTLIVGYGPIRSTPVQTIVFGPSLTGGDNYTVSAISFDVATNGDLTFQGNSTQSSGGTILVNVPAGTVFNTSDILNSSLPSVSQMVRIN